MASADGSAAYVDCDGLENQEYITNPRTGTVIRNHTTTTAPLQNTQYYLRAFTEDNNNTTTDSTPSNEIAFIRPRHKANNTADLWEIVDKSGNTGTGIDVMEEVFVHTAPAVDKTALSSISSVYIDWGDGGQANYDWWGANPSGNPGASATTITFSDTTGLKVGDYLCISQDIGGWKINVRKVTSLTATVATLDSALDAVAWTTSAIVARTRKHRYTETGTKSALCQLMNKQGFQSSLIAVNTSPNPQAIDPDAVFDAEKLTLAVGESIAITGLRSITRNMDKSITWNQTAGPYTHDGGDNSAFAKDTGEDFPTDGSVIGHIVWNQTDGCHGIITSFTGTDQANMSGGLSGGTGNDFDNGDVFYIFGCGWVPVSTTGQTFGDQDAPSTTVSFSSAGTKTIKLHVTDGTQKYDSESKTFTVAAETFDSIHSGWRISNDDIGGGETITVNGNTLTEGVNFSKGGSSTATATAIEAAINTASYDQVFAIATNDMCLVVGAISDVSSNDAAAFEVFQRFIGISIIKNPMMQVDIVPKLGTTGHIRRIKTFGSTTYNLTGDISDVASKDAIEDLNDGTIDYILCIIDGSMRKLYPLTKAAVVAEDASAYVPQDQSTATTVGRWMFSGSFVDGGEYSG